MKRGLIKIQDLLDRNTNGLIEIQNRLDRNTKRFDRNTKLIGWNCRHNWLIVSASFGAATITILHWHPPQFNLTGPRQIFEFEIEIVVLDIFVAYGNKCYKKKIVV